MKSTSIQYGSVAVTLHWLSAIFILAMLGSGFRAASMADGAIKETILMFHVPLGVIILVLTLLRLFWWWRVDQKPRSVEGDPAWQNFTAKAIHVLFYIVILGMAASGIGMLAMSGTGGILFGASAEPLPDFNEVLPRVPHGLGARLMLALFALHAGAALYHHFIKRDGLIWRMWFSANDDEAGS
ncbi:cytochrome b/b6 domain-containing protein [Octadecabacter sp. G9-8]|uniref:Cytochrome b/b6 domain-containing protein n=1 Tax=Octadecabacter dasysiphoniae TaxID=2909341 RepID=A0ABS9CTF1_9RHOB|nr:cytochrome b/b6 domain-containing protein [Octadecabacter dasysiphoniae]MCF2870518.1 cytochrome b/b6 domain-containing protein [Octadecabacter dasysiphoniae]